MCVYVCVVVGHSCIQLNHIYVVVFLMCVYVVACGFRPDIPGRWEHIDKLLTRTSPLASPGFDPTDPVCGLHCTSNVEV